MYNLQSYYDFIEQCKQKQYSGVTHKHHIIPKCMGGPDTKDNLIELSIEDHIKSHLILASCFPDGHEYNWKNLSGVGMLQRFWNNDEHSIQFKKMLSDSAKARFQGKDNPNYGNKWNEEQKQHLSKLRKEKGLSAGENNPMYGKGYLIKGEKNGFYGKTHTEETKQKIAAAGRMSKGVPKQKSTCTKCGKVGGIGQIKRYHNENCGNQHSNNQKVITCPHCNKIGTEGNMKRWHFDNCKIIKK